MNPLLEWSRVLLTIEVVCVKRAIRVCRVDQARKKSNK